MGCKCRASPHYMGSNWQDWAICNYQGKELPCQLLLFFQAHEIDYSRMPALPRGKLASIGKNNNDVETQILEQCTKVTAPGRCAVVHYCPVNCMDEHSQDLSGPFQMHGLTSFPLEDGSKEPWDFTKQHHMMANPNTPIVKWSAKDSNTMGCGRDIGTTREWNRTHPHLGIIKVEDILDTLIGFDDIAGRCPHQVLFLENHNKWGHFLVDRMIEACNDDKDECMKKAGSAELNEEDVNEVIDRLMEEEQDGLEDSEEDDEFHEPEEKEQRREKVRRKATKLTKKRQETRKRKEAAEKSTTARKKR